MNLLNIWPVSNISVIGSGFSSLSAACYLAREGHNVTVYEKNGTVGGRARQFEVDGFRFDMGPTFYWMPDIFERFFADFDSSPGEFYTIRRLDSGYKIYFGEGDYFDQPGSLEELKKSFDRLEPGSGEKLEKYLESAGYNYRVAVDKVIYKPARSPLEVVMSETMSRLPQFVDSLSSRVARSFRDVRLKQMLEFPVLFLGAKPEETPSFYRFMNYADMVLGSWHVEGGMIQVAEGIKRLAESMGVQFQMDSEISAIESKRNRVTGIRANGKIITTDTVVSGADYAHTESLLPVNKRNYRDKYWTKRVFAPSAVLFYIGFDKKIKNVAHHTLFFDASFKKHAYHIYDRPGWPDQPIFYASFPTRTDSTLGPEGKETAIILIPTAPGLIEDEAQKQKYFHEIIRRMEKMTGEKLLNFILFCKSYGCSDFISDYNSYKGNAYGLANTLMQTAFMRPPVYNKNIENLFYTGQLTVPGPGVPTALVSGKIAAEAALRYLDGNKKH
ncbi:MAG: phytoene desaturase [Rikenellaceae bacterium]|nr:phytoene desaturase [Rikenellaceae bacterium]